MYTCLKSIKHYVPNSEQDWYVAVLKNAGIRYLLFTGEERIQINDQGQREQTQISMMVIYISEVLPQFSFKLVLWGFLLNNIFSVIFAV